MAQTKHTPGPWTVDPYGRYINYHNEVVGTSFFLTHETFRDEFKQEQAANMALIAAAPDMLDALKVILNSYESMFEILTDKQKKEYIVGFDGLPSVKKARAAIAKATT